MLKDFKICTIKKSEIPKMCAIHKRVWLNTYDTPQYNLDQTDILSKDFDSPIKINKWKATLESDSYKIWVAKINQEIVGFCGGRKGDSENDFSIIYILPEYQHLGIGRSFAEKILAWLKDKPITVEVAQKNSQAIKFYKKLGFQDFGFAEPTILKSGKRIKIKKMILN